MFSSNLFCKAQFQLFTSHVKKKERKKINFYFLLKSYTAVPHHRKMLSKESKIKRAQTMGEIWIRAQKRRQRRRDVVKHKEKNAWKKSEEKIREVCQGLSLCGNKASYPHLVCTTGGCDCASVGVRVELRLQTIFLRMRACTCVGVCPYVCRCDGHQIAAQHERSHTDRLLQRLKEERKNQTGEMRHKINEGAKRQRNL